ncbi:MAG: hypothetical protein HKN04_04335 [Rhodothermaceae bacterium]|nr:hypothetical protein [Rhodothermaceae bacterium]
MNWQGTLDAIYLAPEAKAPIERVEAVEVIAGRGLKGDRYFKGMGAFSRFPGKRREVTLIRAEALAEAIAEFGIALADGEHRRNLVVSKVPLAELVKQRFRVGEAVLRGVQICAPCKYLVRVTEEPRIFDALVGRGGLRAEILETGTVRQGAVVAPLDV